VPSTFSAPETRRPTRPLAVIGAPGFLEHKPLAHAPDLVVLHVQDLSTVHGAIRELRAALIGDGDSVRSHVWVLFHAPPETGGAALPLTAAEAERLIDLALRSTPKELAEARDHPVGYLPSWAIVGNEPLTTSYVPTNVPWTIHTMDSSFSSTFFPGRPIGDSRAQVSTAVWQLAEPHLDLRITGAKCAPGLAIPNLVVRAGFIGHLARRGFTLLSHEDGRERAALAYVDTLLVIPPGYGFSGSGLVREEPSGLHETLNF
jgi:hypothetical protein